MEPYLAIETSTPVGGVAVGRGGYVLAEVLLGLQARHSEALLPAIDFALRCAGVAPPRLAGVVVGGGPGSFTGIRIAGATAKGLVRALEIPLFAFSGLEAVAATCAVADRAVCALFDARRGEVYAAAYRFPELARIDTVLEPAPWSLASLLERLAGEPALYAGEGALRHRSEIEASGGRVAPAHLALPRPSALLWLADLDPAAGRVAHPASWEPSYLRASGAERSRVP